MTMRSKFRSQDSRACEFGQNDVLNRRGDGSGLHMAVMLAEVCACVCVVAAATAAAPTARGEVAARWQCQGDHHRRTGRQREGGAETQRHCDCNNGNHQCQM
jgi:hypothetical protein